MPALTPLQAANDLVRRALLPAQPAIQRMPIPNSVKADLAVRPLDALLNILMPVEDFFAECLARTLQYVVDDGGSVTERLPIGGVVVDLRVDGVPGDNQLTISTRALIRRLRILMVFSANVLRHPLRLGQAFMETCVTRGMQNLLWMGDWIRAKTATFPAPAALPEGPLHRIWRALPAQARGAAPEPAYLSGLGGEPVSSSAVLAAAAVIVEKCIEVGGTITVSTITTAGQVTIALAGAIVAIKQAELHALEVQIHEENKTERARITGRYEGEPAPVILPGQPGYAPPASEGIPGWALALGVVVGISLLRR